MQDAGLRGVHLVRAPAQRESARLMLAAPDVRHAARVQEGVALLAQKVERGLRLIKPPLNHALVDLLREICLAVPLREQTAQLRGGQRQRRRFDDDHTRVVSRSQMLGVGANRLQLVVLPRGGEQGHVPENLLEAVPLLKRGEHIRADEEIELRVRLRLKQGAHRVHGIALPLPPQLQIGDRDAVHALKGETAEREALLRVR